MREIDSPSLAKGNTSHDKMDAILAKIKSEALGRIFLDSLFKICHRELKARIENSFAKGTDIYLPDVVDTLTRAQNCTMQKHEKSCIRHH